MVADIAFLRNLTLRDMAHKLAGPHVERTLIIAAAVIYLVVLAFFGIITILGIYLVEEHSEDWIHIAEIRHRSRAG